jgi:hypothetical protein
MSKAANAELDNQKTELTTFLRAVTLSRIAMLPTIRRCYVGNHEVTLEHPIDTDKPETDEALGMSIFESLILFESIADTDVRSKTGGSHWQK